MGSPELIANAGIDNTKRKTQFIECHLQQMETEVLEQRRSVAGDTSDDLRGQYRNSKIGKHRRTRRRNPERVALEGSKALECLDGRNSLVSESIPSVRSCGAVLRPDCVKSWSSVSLES